MVLFLATCLFFKITFKNLKKFRSRNNGQPPQKCEERLPSDPSRSVFRLVCPEWRTNPSLLNLPQGIEDHDYEGQPIWSANEDIRLLKVLYLFTF